MASRAERRAQGRRGRGAGGRAPGPRLTGLALVALAAAAVAGVTLLAFVGWSQIDQHDWHAAITIDGKAVNRADARNRLAILQALDGARLEVAQSLHGAGLMSDLELSDETARLTGRDYAAAVAESFVREDAIRAEAARDTVTASDDGDATAVFSSEAYAPFARHVRWLALSAPLASGTPLASSPNGWTVAPAGAATSAPVLAARDLAAADAARAAASTPAADLIASARAAGWDASGGEGWMGREGEDPVIPAVLVDALRADGLKPGTVVGPMRDDASSTEAVGVLLAGSPDSSLRFPERALAQATVDGGALRRWAEGVALEAALRAEKLRAWTTTRSTVVHVRELVVSAADAPGGPGPFAGLAHLVLSRLPAADLPAPSGPLPAPYGAPSPAPTPWPTAPGASVPPPSAGSADPAPGPSLAGLALAAALNALAPADRLARWDALVAAANAGAPAGDPTLKSGEMGWHSRDDLLPAVADAVLRPDAPAGAVVGPVVTAAGEELFLVRGQYLGTLDEHAAGVLAQVTAASGDAALGAIAVANASRAEALRWDLGIDRSELELAGNDAAQAALLRAPLGARSDPYALGGSVVAGVPVSRSTAVPSGQALARVRVGAFDTWVLGLMARRSVTVDTDPFGQGATTSPPATPTIAPGLPTMPPLPSAGLPSLAGSR